MIGKNPPNPKTNIVSQPAAMLAVAEAKARKAYTSPQGKKPVKTPAKNAFVSPGDNKNSRRESVALNRHAGRWQRGAE